MVYIYIVIKILSIKTKDIFIVSFLQISLEIFIHFQRHLINSRVHIVSHFVLKLHKLFMLIFQLRLKIGDGTNSTFYIYDELETESYTVKDIVSVSVSAVQLFSIFFFQK